MARHLSAFVGGCLLVLALPAFPAWSFLAALLPLMVLSLARQKWLFWLLAGFVISLWQISAALDERLHDSLDGRTLWLEGQVTGLPQWQQTAQGQPLVRFELAQPVSRRGSLPRRLRLSWVDPPELRAGERWRLAVSLKKPYGLQNPHGFDYQRWLLAQQLGATGAVRTGQRLDEARGVSCWREALREQLQDRLQGHPATGAVLALALGDGSALQREQWALLQDSGTVHLFVISGQHVGLVAGLAYGLIALCVRLGLWPMRWPWLVPACVLAMLAALLYGALAGFAVPVQRSLIMTFLVLLWRMSYQPLASSRPWLLALALVLLTRPLAMLQPGFWLSFLAVAVLLLVFTGRLGRWRGWRLLWRAQWAVCLGLLPVLLASGLPLSKVGLLANLLAIPLVSLAILPLILLGMLALPWPQLAALLLQGAAGILQALWWLLEWLVQGWPAWQGMSLGPISLALATIGVVLLLLPRGVRPAWLASVLLLPALWPAPPIPLREGVAQIWLLDVGQGQAIVIRTRQHALMYDAGPNMGGTDAGATVVVPFLRGERIARLERLILSHADADHAGGAESILAAITVQQLISGEPQRHPALQAQPCRAESWQLDGVQFSQWQWQAATDSNAASCVLLIEASGERFLVTGDLDLAGERALLQAFPGLEVHWLVAGHHGSRTSTGWNWLQQLKPGHVLLSRGRYNSYGHPHPLVLLRVERSGAQLSDTAQVGALRIELGRFAPVWSQSMERRFWRRQ